MINICNEDVLWRCKIGIGYHGYLKEKMRMRSKLIKSWKT